MIYFMLSTHDEPARALVSTFYGRCIHFVWKGHKFSREQQHILYGRTILFLRKRCTFSIKQLYIFYGKGCIFSTEKPVHIHFYGSVMHFLRNSYAFSNEVLHIFYGACVSLTGHRSILLTMVFPQILHPDVFL